MGWYEDPELYHYIGYLIYTEFSNINELIKLYDSKLNSPKSEFRTDIIALIKEKVGKYQLEQLSFDKQADYEKIKKALLLFNVETTLKSTPYNYFPFYKYKYNQWSLEHIHAQQSEKLTDSDAIKNWIIETKTEVEKFLNDTEKKQEAEKLILDFEEMLKLGKNMKLADLPKKVYSFFGGNPDDIHSFSNMALLDKATNSSLNNSIFPIKRKMIFEAESLKKAFIPVCTKYVFLKFYNEDINHMQFWSKKDRDDYILKISNTLKSFIS